MFSALALSLQAAEADIMAPADVPVAGSLELIAGPMFSGKTSELCRRVQNCGGQAIVVRPGRDTRDVGPYLQTHDGSTTVRCTLVLEHARELEQVDAMDTSLGTVPGCAVFYAFDEAQFYHAAQLRASVERLLSRGRRVLVVGLSGTFARQPWDYLGLLLPLCTVGPTLLRARCSDCERPDSATWSFLLPQTSRAMDPGQLADAGAGQAICLGGKGAYQALCPPCWAKATAGPETSREAPAPAPASEG